ncbi:MAG: LCP family protein [Clostridia bacterium]|nr:LCP family protein [Clostridia bacterium]MBQ9323417.1 LCP family protein [Clostridia bacterium]MBR0420963.1 LCP family protein [Clostridia bacterium]
MKKKIFVIMIVMATLIIIMGAYQIHRITDRPESYFEKAHRVSAEVTPAPTPLFDLSPYLSKQQAKATPIQMYIPGPAVPTADPDPLGEGKPLSGIVNIALFGIDAFENGGTTSGTMPHTDANMIVAVNFDTKEVSLISIARDIFTDVPGHDGFYKFNCIFNVGGGMEDPKAGLELSCRAAEEWLGGVSVPYYFGLDFKAAVDVVDAIGGIDYDSEIDLYDFNRKIIAYKGQHHLDGAGVFAYLRMRKTAGGLDYMRTARQRKMMIALFRKIKEAGQLPLIPNILEAMGQDIYTNMSVPQIAALTSFAADIDPDQIRSYSIHGDMYEQYFWRYSMIDQQKRIDILKEVYGIDAAPMPVDTVVYEKFLYDSGFIALQHLGYAKRLFAYVHDVAGQGELSEAQKKAYALCWQDTEALRAKFDEVDQWTKERYDKIRLPVDDQNQRIKYYRELNQREKQLRSSGDALNKAFGSPLELKWTQGANNWYLKGSVINEVYVNFQ